MSTNHVDLTVHEALSGVLASISLSSWILFFIPQVLENRRNQSGEAVSISFILIRFASDLCNLIGGQMAHIIPGMIAVAGEYCISDVLLISQVVYYGVRNRLREGKDSRTAVMETLKGNLNPVKGSSTKMAPHDSSACGNHTITNGERDEDSPLLCEHADEPYCDGSHCPKQYHAITDPIDNLTEMLDDKSTSSTTHTWLKNLGIALLVCVIGTAGWALAYHFGVWTPVPEEREAFSDQSEEVVAKSAQVLGYASAALSLGCRIPQILKNWRHKSCEGLSILFFILSLIGNLTYGASILFHSTQKDYVVKNIPWAVGSLGTIAQDVLILFQFRLYRRSS